MDVRMRWWMRRAIPALAALLLLAGAAVTVRAEEVEVVQFPDANYEPGPGWPAGWTPPPVPTAITKATQELIAEGIQQNPQFTRVEMRVLDPLPRWTQEYPYYWLEDVIGCGDAIIVYWYPMPDSRVILREFGRHFGGSKLMTGEACRFYPVQAISEAKEDPELKEANKRSAWLQEEMKASRAGLDRASGLYYEGRPDAIEVFLNGGLASPRFDVPAYLDTRVSRVRVPIRFVSELMGARVDWHEASQQVTIHFPAVSRQVLKAVPAPGFGYADLFDPEEYLPDAMRYLLQEQTVSTPAKTIVLTIGQPEALVDGQPVAIDAPPVVKDGRTMVPIRFIAEQMGCKVYWVGDQPIFDDGNGRLSGTYQVQIFTPFYPLYEYPSWYLEHRAMKF